MARVRCATESTLRRIISKNYDFRFQALIQKVMFDHFLANIFDPNPKKRLIRFSALIRLLAVSGA